MSTSPQPCYEEALSEALQYVLDCVPHQGDRNRLRVLLTEAVLVVETLGETDFSAYENTHDELEGPALWEKLAPIVAITQKSVYRLLESAQTQYPAPVFCWPVAHPLVSHTGYYICC